MPRLFHWKLPYNRLDDDLGRGDEGSLLLGQDLDALGRRVSPLVKLAGQILDREPLLPAPERKFAAGGVDLRFGEKGRG